ncbi:MAG: FHA domain-containing protein [Bdellovibrionales bacterium]|jgi:pSer/pThr/pTyr-binding forkhead associated (FHA) protein/tetratricopeptide (TPR) repeat protein|nr:FHA domain-containing protein [Bdellovibrionales bacterium]
MMTLKVLLHGKDISELILESGQEYVFGRGEGCTIQLDDQPGISRQHFKIAEENGQWVARVLSKFGELVLAGTPVSDIELSHGSVFKLAGYDFKFLEIDAASRSVQQDDHAQPTALQTAVGTEAQAPTFAQHGEATHNPGNLPAKHPGTLSLIPSHAHGATAATAQARPQGFAAPSSFEGNEEATNVGVVLPARPSLRIVKSDGTELRAEMDGKKWLAGREDTCDIFLPDRKASRRQFEINSTPEGYFITDLGSANGTVLNGDPLIPEEPRSLQSGDVISVQSLLLHFEIRDPSFEKRLVAIPQEIMAAPSMLPVPRFEIINYPVPQGYGGGGNGGAVRVDGYSDAEDPEKKKQKLMRMVLIGIIVLGGLYALTNEEDSGPTTSASSEKTDALSRLSSQQLQTVKELYVTARNLYMQNKFENAHEQLKKLHAILPEGYELSKAMEEDCIAQRDAAERLAFAEQEQKQIEEQRRLIDRNVRQCNSLANSSFDVNEIRRCLAPTIGLDPTNPLVADLIGRVERRVAERDQRQSVQRAHADRVARGRALYETAHNLQKKSDWYPAIDAYNRHIASEFPDPNGLKDRSQAAIVQIRNMISSRVDELLQVAQSSYQSKNYKEALEAAKKAKEFDPKNDKSAEFIGRVRRELDAQMRTIYEDAILREGVGRVQEAQVRWKQIMEKDTTDGEYYQKSRIKLRNYSEQIQ